MTTHPAPVDVLRSAISGNIYAALRAWARQNSAGMAFPAGLYYVLWRDAPEVNRARRPDASFVRRERLPKPFDALMPFYGAPDLAVEVVSQTDPEIFTLEKVRDYLTAGTAQAWMCYSSPLNEIHVYDAETPGQIRVYRGDDVLEGGALLPGFALRASDAFEYGG
jgi:Uma2 family endonuclease